MGNYAQRELGGKLFLYRPHLRSPPARGSRPSQRRQSGSPFGTTGRRARLANFAMALKGFSNAVKRFAMNVEQLLPELVALISQVDGVEALNTAAQ